MPAPRNNHNAAGKRINRERIKIDLSLSERNGLLDLASDYLARQGVEPSDKQLRRFASEWFYLNFGAFLKREIEDSEAMIL